MILQNRSGSGQFGAPSYMTTGCAIRERTIDDIAVAGDPTDIGRAPEDILIADDRRHIWWWNKCPPDNRRWCAKFLSVCRSIRWCRECKADARCRGARAGNLHRRIPVRDATKRRGLPPCGCRLPARRKTITRRTEVPSRSASSTFFFSGTIPPRRYAPSAVMTAIAPLSLIRSRMLSALNPPNTTECTAPIRAQASMAIAASGMFGR